jgi:creatinine amidohydrolase
LGADDLLESGEYGHACEAETSVMLHMDPDLVKMEQVPSQAFSSLGRNAAIAQKGGYSPVDWYAMYPYMYVGDASKASAEKGQKMVEHEVKSLAALIKAVKDDDVSPGLLEEFIERRQKPKAPDYWTSGK